MTTTIDDFLGTVEFALDDDNDVFLLPGEATTYKANEWSVAQEGIVVNGVERRLNTRVKFVHPILTSFALRTTDAVTRTNRKDFNATIATNRVLEVEIDGNWVPIEELVRKMIRAANPSKSYTDTDIDQKLIGYGWEPHGRLPMYLQHLGADEEAFLENAKHFMYLGADENKAQVAKNAQGTKSKLTYSFRHRTGVAVRSLDISKVNRDLSLTGTGFIGFGEGAWNTFLLIMKIDRERSAIRKVLESDPTNEVAAKRQADIRDIFETGVRKRAFRNWGGTTETSKPNVLLLGETSYTYYPQQVPCGRFAVEDGIGSHGTELYSVWGTRKPDTTEENEESGEVESLLVAPPAADMEPF